MQRLLTSDDLWVTSDEEEYNEIKELAGKSTEVSKHCIECPVQWNWAPHCSCVKHKEEGGRKKVEQPLKVKVKE